MKLRDLVLLLSGAMTAARHRGAQQKAMPVIGWLSALSPALLDGKIGRFGALQNLVDVVSREPKHIGDLRAIRHQIT